MMMPDIFRRQSYEISAGAQSKIRGCFRFGTCSRLASMHEKEISTSRMKTRSLTTKKTFVIAGICGCLIAVGMMAVLFPPSSSARRAWKEKAFAEIAARMADPAWVEGEIKSVKQQAAADPSSSDAWFSDRLILMRNGDWLAYANICSKEDKRIQDLFLARGSDGRWYYSTYHFCIGLVVLRMEEPSDDLPAFVKTYYLRQFDGKSDECLQKTWPLDPR
jgi:hypothetical protein